MICSNKVSKNGYENRKNDDDQTKDSAFVFFQPFPCCILNGELFITHGGKVEDFFKCSDNLSPFPFVLTKLSKQARNNSICNMQGLKEKEIFQQGSFIKE